MTDVTIIGNCGEPQAKVTPAGRNVLEFSVAENHQKKVDGKWVGDGETWRRVSHWDRKGVALGEALRKGDLVIVIGTERLRTWENHDGTKGSRLEVTAKEVGIIPKVPKQQDGGNDYDAARANTGNTAQAGGNWGGGDGWGNGSDTEPPF